MGVIAQHMAQTQLQKLQLRHAEYIHLAGILEIPLHIADKILKEEELITMSSFNRKPLDTYRIAEERLKSYAH